MEPFWDLKIDTYRVSDTCIQRLHYKLSATFSDKYTYLPNFTLSLGWRNPADSLALYIVYAAVVLAMLRPIWSSPRSYIRCCQVCLLWSKRWNVSLLRSTVGFRLHLCDWDASVSMRCACMHAARVHEPLRWVGRVSMEQKSFSTYHP